MVFKKVDKVLKNIRLFRSQKENQLKYPVNYNNEVEKLNNEVLAWHNDRKNEIERLKQLESYRKEFLGNVSHELKTPVFNIQGYTSTLLDGGLEDQNINRKYLERTEKSVERIISMIEDLESINQLESGELELEKEDFDIYSLTEEVVKSLEFRANQKGILTNLPKDKNAIKVHADKFRIRQVLENLLNNAIKYGKEYGQTSINFYKTPMGISIEIADNGIGIDKSDINRLFERFYRVDKSRSSHQGGTGLGLAIVKHIIEAHNQKISVTSELGKGTTFSFLLPEVKNA